MKKGFTLIEILGAILILAGLVTVVSRISYGVFERSQKGRRLEIIVHLLERKMTDIKVNQEFSSLSEEEKGEFEEEEGFVWSYKTRSLSLPPASILLTLRGLPQSELNVKAINIAREILSKTVKELKLTVTDTRAKKDISYSLVTYFVDYKQVPTSVSSIISQMIPNQLIPGLEEGESL